MNIFDFWPILVPISGFGVVLLIWWLYRISGEIHIERARESFRLQRELLSEQFLLAANHSGKPRGLRWASAQMKGELLLKRDPESRGLIGLVLLDIHFEVIPDGGMEDCEASKVPRTVTAIFYFRKGKWITNGRAVFNLSPEQVVDLSSKS